MNNKEALNIINQGLQAANKSGVFSLNDSVLMVEALKTIAGALNSTLKEENNIGTDKTEPDENPKK